MPFIKRQTEDGYIIVHHLRGDRQAIEFLRATSMTLLERLCFQARTQGQAKFTFQDNDFTMTWNRDGTFNVQLEENRSIFEG